MTAQLLIVDDEPSIRRVLAMQLRRLGHDVFLAANGDEAVALLSRTPIDTVISDVKMPGMDGLELMRWVHATQPSTPVVLLTAHGTIDLAVDALKQGAFDFLTKPFDLHDLHRVVQQAIRAKNNASSHLADTDEIELLGQSPAIQKLRSVVQRVAPTPATVLISGEMGTGKQLLARIIHQRSARSDKTFVSVALSGLAQENIDVELFGSPDIDSPKLGRLALADGGTIRIDDIECMPLATQAKLLQLLQTGAIDKHPASVAHVDVRLIATTTVDILSHVQSGTFREDLFYRLAIVPLHLPPLRDRPDDIAHIAKHVLLRAGARLGTQPTTLNDDALQYLQNQSWPGNLRALETTIERAALLVASSSLSLEDLETLKTSSPILHQRPDTMPVDLSLRDYMKTHIERLERHHITEALLADDGNVTRAAQRLGISRRSLQMKMKEYRLRED